MAPVAPLHLKLPRPEPKCCRRWRHLLNRRNRDSRFQHLLRCKGVLCVFVPAFGRGLIELSGLIQIPDDTIARFIEFSETELSVCVAMIGRHFVPLRSEREIDVDPVPFCVHHAEIEFGGKGFPVLQPSRTKSAPSRNPARRLARYHTPAKIGLS